MKLSLPTDHGAGLSNSELNMSKKSNNNEETLARFVNTAVYALFDQHPNRSFNHKQVSKQIKEKFRDFLIERGGAHDEDDVYELLKNAVVNSLHHHSLNEDLIEVSKGKFKLKPKHAYLEGNIEITSGGAAYLLSEDEEEEDVFIAPSNVKNALHGDRVKVFLYAKHKKQRMEGEVVEILKRAKSSFAGILQVSGKYAFVVPDSPRMLVDIFVPGHLLNNGLEQVSTCRR